MNKGNDMKTSKLTKLLIKATDRARTLGDEKLTDMLEEVLEHHNSLDAQVYEMELALYDMQLSMKEYMRSR